MGKVHRAPPQGTVVWAPFRTASRCPPRVLKSHGVHLHVNAVIICLAGSCQCVRTTAQYRQYNCLQLTPLELRDACSIVWDGADRRSNQPHG